MYLKDNQKVPNYLEKLVNMDLKKVASNIYKKEDVFLNFEDARAEAMRRGSSLVIEVRRDKNGL